MVATPLDCQSNNTNWLERPANARFAVVPRFLRGLRSYPVSRWQRRSKSGLGFARESSATSAKRGFYSIWMRSSGKFDLPDANEVPRLPAMGDALLNGSLEFRTLRWGSWCLKYEIRRGWFSTAWSNETMVRNGIAVCYDYLLIFMIFFRT